MKTNRWVLGAALVGSFVVLQGCGGAGQYQIPNVEPVVKQKPEEDALEAELEGGDSSAASKPAETPKAEPKPEAKPAETKPAETKPEAEAKPDAKASGTKAEPAKGTKPTGKK